MTQPGRTTWAPEAKSEATATIHDRSQDGPSGPAARPGSQSRVGVGVGRAQRAAARDETLRPRLIEGFSMNW